MGVGGRAPRALAKEFAALWVDDADVEGLTSTMTWVRNDVDGVDPTVVADGDLAALYTARPRVSPGDRTHDPDPLRPRDMPDSDRGSQRRRGAGRGLRRRAACRFGTSQHPGGRVGLIASNCSRTESVSRSETWSSSPKASRCQFGRRDRCQAFLTRLADLHPDRDQHPERVVADGRCPWPAHHRLLRCPCVCWCR